MFAVTPDTTPAKSNAWSSMRVPVDPTAKVVFSEEAEANRKCAAPLIKADPILLEQAIYNLVDNALVHAPGSDNILIRAVHRNGVSVDVIDEGPGLEKGSEAKIFGKFARADAVKSGGAGLGLAIVKGFATLMGATVSAHTRTDQHGAVFTISFPESAVVADRGQDSVADDSRSTKSPDRR